MNAEITLAQRLQAISGEPVEIESCVQEIQDMNQSYIHDAVRVIEKNEQENLGDLLKSHRKLRKTMAGLARTQQESLFYECGIFIGAYKLLEEIHGVYLLQEEQQKSKRLLERRYVREILDYLYQNPDARQGKIAEDVKIRPNYLSEILNLLLTAGYVQRYGKNKATRYRLTKAGRSNCSQHKAHMEEVQEYVEAEYRDVFEKEQFLEERAGECVRMGFKEEAVYEKYRVDFQINTNDEPVLWWAVGRNHNGHIKSES